MTTMWGVQCKKSMGARINNEVWLGIHGVCRWNGIRKTGAMTMLRRAMAPTCQFTDIGPYGSVLKYVRKCNGLSLI